MSNEQGAYLDNLRELESYFGKKRVLTVRDVIKYTGRSYHWCKKAFQIDAQKGITLVSLARKLSAMGGES